jgi:hypothetical protein
MQTEIKHVLKMYETRQWRNKLDDKTGSLI